MVTLQDIIAEIRRTKADMMDCPFMDSNVRYTAYVDEGSLSTLLCSRWVEYGPDRVYQSELRFSGTVMGALVIPVLHQEDYLMVYVE